MSDRVVHADTGTRGSILVLSLWVLFTLSALSVAVSSHVAALVRAADRAQRVERGNAAVAAGVALAQVMAAERTNTWDGIVTGEWNTDPELFAGVDVGGVAVRVEFVTGPVDEPVTNVGLVGCEGSVNINTADTVLLEAYLTEVGGMSAAVAAKVANAIVEERQRRLTPEGEEPGEDAPGEGPAFRSLYELAAIDGLDADAVAELAPGLTVHGSGMLNLNATSYDVLRSLFVAVGGPSSRKTAERLAERISRLHAAGKAFETPSLPQWKETLRTFDTSIGRDEQMLLQRSAPRSGISSTCFKGRAVAHLRSETEAIVAVDFVIDTKRGYVDQWSTR